MQLDYSIIIPTLNEVDCLAETIRRVRASVEPDERYEIVVADSGSTDGTQDLARNAGVRLVEDVGVRCRADACNLGASAAAGRILIFLDADTLVPGGFLEEVRRVLEKPRNIGGAFEFALSGQGFGLRVIELINRIRYRIWRRYYGDQALFVEARVFQEVGGFPPRKILESSDLCLLLRQRGRLGLARRAVLTSSRRFREGGVWTVFGRDIWIWFLDLVGLRTDRFGAPYWNYNRARG